MTPPRTFWRRTLALAIALSAFAGATAQAADSTKKSFDVPAGNAAASLKVFSEQSGEQIVYPVDRMQNISTKAVHGEFTAREALDRMIAGSGLVVVQDEKTGAYAVRPSAAAATPERNPLRASEVPTPAAAKSSGPAKGNEEGGQVLTLSPFEVNAGNDRGYQAISTMSGTRLNSKLEDLGASLSVVTKQQLQDTASTDINDIFRYELNTEGTYQWTNISVDRGVVSDGVQNDPQGSTRMRGLTAPNFAMNGFTTTLPVDTYNVEAVEISRGPNSTVFGLGNTGGGVNIIPSRANTTREISSFSTRGDSYDGYRGTFDINRQLLPGRLAVRFVGLYEEKGYVRKPSKDTTRRLEAMVTVRPSHSTMINASFESYRNFNNRPNTLTPRDTATDWISSGRPTWDPITSTVHFADGRAPVTVTTAQEATLLPYGLAVSDSTFQGSPSSYVEQNGSVGLFMINRMPAATGIGPNNVSGTSRLLQSGNYYIRNSAANPLFNSKEISDKSLYDWTSINLTAPNFVAAKGETSSIQLDQMFLHSQRQTLALQAGWLYERTSSYDRRFLGSGSANLQPYIDINEKLLDGTPNPYFLRTYVGGAAPGFKKSRSFADNYRATLAYELDLTHEQNWVRWLGRHNFSGYGEYRSLYNAGLGYQDTISSNNTWMNGTPASRNSASFRTYPRYFVGDANGQNVDYAPARTSSPPYAYSLRYFNGVANSWVNETVTYDEYYDANRPIKRRLSTGGGTWQGFFWSDRIVPLLGIRKDSSRSREANSAINPTVATNGYLDTSPFVTYAANPWVKNEGITRTAGIVVKPLSWLHLSYSQSNAFSPGAANYDVWGNPLPDPHGKTKEYGFQFSFFPNRSGQPRLTIVAKQYETVDIGRSTSDLNTIVQRTDRMDRRTSSGDPGLTDWLQAQLLVVHPDWTDTQLIDEVKKETGVDPDYIRSHINKVHGDASDSFSRGKEVEIVFNPTNYWRIKFTGSESNPLNGILSPEVQDYIDFRMPTWTTIKDPVSGNTWWTSPESNGTIPQTFYINNVLAPLKLAVALQGKRRSQTRQYHASFLTNYNLGGLTDNRWLKNLSVGSSVRWEDKASIGFYGAAPDPDGIVRLFDPNRPIYDKARYYLDLSAGYRMRLFQDKVQCRLQLNVNNVFENGRLQAISVNPDGTPWAFRIIDPRQFILSATFDL